MSLTPTPYGGRPGLDIPLNFHDAILETLNEQNRHCMTPHEGYFPCVIHPLDLAAYRASIHCLTIREITMLQIMQQITCKPDWNIKIFDEEIVKKWRFEATSNPSADVSDRMLDYIIAELHHEAKTYEKTGHFVVYNLVAISDVALSASFRDNFNKAVRPLEDVPDRMKDWHPGSHGKVLDLVHPSLFPLVYGRTRALEVSESVPLFEAVTLCGKGNVVPVPLQEATEIVANSNLGWEINRANYSRKFQWLPCEVDISGPSAKITSYINNLHPTTHQPLYNLIEQVIDTSIPLWNSTLSRTIHHNDIVLRVYYGGSYVEDVNEIQQPEPKDFTPPPAATLNLKKKYGQTGLQVIVKLANIELTPEKPRYEGGSWHVEGQLNEHICATSLYYYSNENITSNTLAFRHQCDPVNASEADYPQDFHDWLPIIYGASVGDAGVQVLGGVNTLEGRLLTFPNILQHQVQPFELADPTKNGHRKILALFLVDPNIKIISTANVPCQRADWWRQEIDEMGNDSTTNQLHKLPRELQDEVFRAVEDFPISLEEAKSLRLELMEERKNVQVKQNRAFSALEFSLCEH